MVIARCAQRTVAIQSFRPNQGPTKVQATGLLVVPRLIRDLELVETAALLAITVKRALG
jgi:hypothetical protein